MPAPTAATTPTASSPHTQAGEDLLQVHPALGRHPRRGMYLQGQSQVAWQVSLPSTPGPTAATTPTASKPASKGRAAFAFSMES